MYSSVQNFRFVCFVPKVSHSQAPAVSHLGGQLLRVAKEAGRREKSPFYICMASEQPFAIAELWEQWQPSGESDAVLSCAIIAYPPNEMLKQVHHRMPVIVDHDAYDQWLEPTERPPGALNQLLKPYPAEEVTAYPVSRLVNKPQTDTPACTLPA